MSINLANNLSITHIQKFPSVIDNTHESCYKSYHILEKVKRMLIRNDSQETILEVILECEKTTK